MSLSQDTGVTSPNNHTNTHHSNDTQLVRAMYYVQAVSDPGLLPRLIQPLAKLGLVPDRVFADREWHGDRDLNVELRLLNIDVQKAVLLENTLASVIGVRKVIAVID